jgi:RNA polymerase sigma-54 factor
VKQLFTEAMQTADGDSISNAAIQKVLEHCIETEDKKNPLTDERLADLLKEAGYPIARRTVAKYREQLGYSTARLRREV